MRDIYAPNFQWANDSLLGSMEAYHQMYDRSIADPSAFWAEQARETLTWDRDFHTVADTDMATGSIAWFLGG